MIPGDVIWSYSVAGAIFAIWLAVLLRSGDWQRARGFDGLILFGPIFYVVPLAAFGTEHFTQARGIASAVPKWIPWHLFWAYFIGACFILAPLSIVTRIQARLSASLLALTFFLFVVLMDLPAWSRNPGDQFALMLALRELSFSGGALALVATLTQRSNARRAAILATIARYFVAVPALVYSFEQFMHTDHVPGVPLRPLTPAYVYGHVMWTYLAAAAYAIASIPLLIGRKTRAAATLLGATVLFLVLVVYVPIGIVDRTSLRGLNFVFDTLMYGGAVLLLAGAMPREVVREVVSEVVRGEPTSAAPWPGSSTRRS